MSAWIELVKAKYALGKETCKEYTLKQAIQAAKKEYKKPKETSVSKYTQKRKKNKRKTIKKKRSSKK